MAGPVMLARSSPSAVPLLSWPVRTLTGSPFWNLRMLLTSQPCVRAFGPCAKAGIA